MTHLKTNSVKPQSHRRPWMKLFAISLIGLGAWSWGGCHPKSPEDRAEWMTKKLTKKLDLNEAQQAKFKAAALEMSQTHKKMREEHKKIAAQLIEEAKKPEIKAEDLVKLFGDHQKLAAEQAPIFSAKIVELHKDLTPVQREKLVKFLTELQEKMEKWH